MNPICSPKCNSELLIKSGVVINRQCYKCKQCAYFFTVMKDVKSIDPYYIIKALQLYIEGVTYREIERILGVSHVSVMNWVKKFNIKAPENSEYRPTYSIFKHEELLVYLKDRSVLQNSGLIITELGDKYMIIKWERFKK